MKIIKLFSMDGARQEEQLYIVTGVFRKRIYLVQGVTAYSVRAPRPTKKGSK